MNLTESELQQGRDFINQASHYTQEIPIGEIHMLTDLLGISELVELLHDTHSGTEDNLEGPLYVPNAPERQMGDRLGIDAEGDSLFLFCIQWGMPQDILASYDSDGIEHEPHTQE